MFRIKQLALYCLALAAFLVTGACLVAMVRVLAVPETLPAVESAFGTGVVALLFLVLGVKAWRAGSKKDYDR